MPHSHRTLAFGLLVALAILPPPGPAGTAAARDAVAGSGDEAATDSRAVAGSRDAVRAGWAATEGPGDLNADGAIDMRDVLHALLGREPAWRAGAAGVGSPLDGTSFIDVTAELFVGEGWGSNGYVGLDTYRLYANFDGSGEDEGVLSVFGIGGEPMSWLSGSGEFHNDAIDSLTAPQDLREEAGYWSNQWDTYVTINATDADGDATFLSPGFAEETNGLARSFTAENAGWLVTPDDPQSRAVDGRVLLGQITVAAGVDVSGTLNLLLLDRTGVLDVPFVGGDPQSLGACCLPDGRCTLTRPDLCEDAAGEFLGFGAECSRQFVTTPCHPGDSARHCVRFILTCPESKAPTVGCEPGPTLDPWITAAGFESTFHDFGGAGQALPADFFRPGSDPFTDRVDLRSRPLGPVDLRAFGGGVVEFGDADTILLRSADPFGPCVMPSEEERSVDIDIIALSLESAQPLLVTFNGGKDPEEWDLTVSLSSVRPPSGTLRAVKSFCNGGTYAIDALLVQPHFTFKQRGGPRIIHELDTGEAGLAPITLTLEDAAWVSAVDGMFSVPNPYCTAFHPGVDERDPATDCDCNGNDVHDRCDIDGGTSADCNGNLVPDECDIASGRSGDCNGDGVPNECDCLADIDETCAVDIGDLLAVLARWGPCACREDLDRSGAVDIGDILMVLATWGPCS